MKTEEEIEKITKKLYPICPKSLIEEFERVAYKKGYLQCQEDIKPLLKNLFDLWETLAKCGEISVGIDFTKHYERLKQQLNKQD
jgi:hypothetical protein